MPVGQPRLRSWPSCSGEVHTKVPRHFCRRSPRASRQSTRYWSALAGPLQQSPLQGLPLCLDSEQIFGDSTLSDVGWAENKVADCNGVRPKQMESEPEKELLL